MPGRVRTRRQFALFATPTARGQSGPLRISFVAAPEAEDTVLAAYAIGRQVGNAVVRNRVRRRLRALFDDLRPQPQPGSYLVRCAAETGNLNYEQLRHHLQQSVARANAR